MTRDERGGGRRDEGAPGRSQREVAPRRGQRDAAAGRGERNEAERPAWEQRIAHARRDKPRSPLIPERITPEDLDFGVRVQLKTLTPENAERVARHLAMAALLIDDDPELAHRHAQAAANRAGRIAVVREAVGVTAYRTGDFATALRELLTYRRISGSNNQMGLVVDCERGLGRPAKGLEQGRSVDRSKLEPEARVQLAIAMSGARLDLEQPDQALLELEIPELDPSKVFDYSVELFHAYAEVLGDLGREKDSAKWRTLAERAEKALAKASGRDADVVELIEEIEMPKSLPRREDRPAADRGQRTDRPGREYGDRPDRPRREYGDRPDRPRREYGDRPERPKREYGDRPERPKREYGDRPERPKREYGDRPDRPERPKREYGDRPDRPERPKREYGDRPDRPERPKREYGDKPERPKLDFGDSPRRPRRDDGGSGERRPPRADGRPQRADGRPPRTDDGRPPRDDGGRPRGTGGGGRPAGGRSGGPRPGQPRGGRPSGRTGGRSG